MGRGEVLRAIVVWLAASAIVAGVSAGGGEAMKQRQMGESEQRYLSPRRHPPPPGFVIVGNDEGQIWYIPFDEEGNFGPKSLITSLGGIVRGVSIFDYENDSDLDFVALVLPGGDTDLFLFENDGSNTFSLSQISETIPTAQEPFWHALSHITASDFNGDGYVDLVLSSADGVPTDLYLFVNESGSGNFGQFFVETANWGNRAAKMDAGDFNGDGNADFVIFDYRHAGDFQGEVYLYTGDGGGGFTTAHVFTTEHAVTTIAAGDFDNDGDLDVIVGLDDDGDPGQAWLYRGHGDGTFCQTGEEVFDLDPTHELGSDWDEGHGTADVYDFNRDGNMDVVATAIGEPVGQNSKVYFIEGYGDGTFPPTPNEMVLIAQDLGVNFAVSAPFSRSIGELATISGGKFYDSNANGEWDTGEVGIGDWLVLLERGGETSGYSVVRTVMERDERADIAPSVLTSSSSNGGVGLLSVDSTYTDSSGHYSFLDLEPGPYTVREMVPPPPPVWLPTTSTEYSVTLQAGQNLTGVDFGNVALGEIGARTIGYWKNHLERITPEMFAVLDTLPAFVGCGNPDSVLAILTPPWADMAAKLRAQLLAMTLNVLSGIVPGGAIVYLGDDVLAAELLFGEPPPSFESAQGVLDAVESFYDWSGWSGSEQEEVKDLLDRMNNDLLFILPGPPERVGSLSGIEGRVCLGGQHEATGCTYYLSQNTPNPFSSSTVVSYQLPAPGHVSLRVYDLSGRLVRTLVDGDRRSGVHSVEWDGRGDDRRRVCDGVYFYRMDVAGNALSRRALVVRR